MGGDAPKSLPALGFLTAIEHADHGLFGGYLVLNCAGRPLEFHCTAPIKPSRAQQILYGPTLESYLFGEQIGQTLVTRGRHTVQAVLTDCPAMMAVRPHVTLPMALVTTQLAEPACDQPPGTPADDRDDQRSGGRPIRRVDPPHLALEPLAPIRSLACRLAVAATHPGDAAPLAEHLSRLDGGLDLLEPFDRIRDAIEEARRAAR